MVSRHEIGSPRMLVSLSNDSRGQVAQPIGVSIIIVNWNSADYLRACIRTIVATTVALSYEIIVVDNASSDGCGDILALEYPDVLFVQTGRNSGFAAANNLGAVRSRGEVLLFLNPDTEVQRRAIEHLFETLQYLTDAGVLGCRLLNSDGSLQTSCVQALPTVWNQFIDSDVLRRCFPRAGVWGTTPLLLGSTHPQPVEAVSGACMMIRRSVFERVGGFSTDYFMYTEDLDLCWKARREGLRNYYVHYAVVIHHGGGSSRNALSCFSTVMMRQSMAQFLRITRGAAASHVYRASMFIASLVRLALLVALLPIFLWTAGCDRWQSARLKWLAILRWSVGHSVAIPVDQRASVPASERGSRAGA
jgi:N-acetylglucosaminyl-diphospho-decaprenol L-rhamnosyltransferase